MKNLKLYTNHQATNSLNNFTMEEQGIEWFHFRRAHTRNLQSGRTVPIKSAMVRRIRIIYVPTCRNILGNAA